MTRSRLLLGLAIVSVATLSALKWATPAAANPSPGMDRTPGARRIGVGCLGRIEPASRIRHLAQSEALGTITVAELRVTEGQRVEAGAVLARFADHPRRVASLLRAEAEVRVAESQLERVRAGAKPGEIESAAARVTRETERLAEARRELDRWERLLSAGSVTAAEVDARRTAAATAVAELAAARQSAAAVAEIRAVDVAWAEAELARARAAQAVAASEVELAELRAPLAGTVLRIHTRTGEQVRAQGVLDLADLTQMDAVAEVYETDAPQVQEGAPARVLLPGGTTLHGQVSEIGWSIRKQDLLDVDPVADIDTRVLEVRVRLDEAGAEAVRRRSNQRVQVVIEPSSAASPSPAPQAKPAR